MGKIYSGSAPLSKVYNVSINAPLDCRVAVRYIADLTTGDNDGIAAQVYKGMIVYVQEDNSLYIYTGSSTSTWKTSKGKLVNGGDIENWKKVDSFLDPSYNLNYYAGKIGARIVESVDDLTLESMESPYAGMFAVVAGGSDESDFESELYILLDADNTDINNWKKIESGSGNFITRDELDEYAKKSELPSVEGLASEEWVEGQGYLKAEDLPDYLMDSDLDEYAKISDLEDYLKVEELPTNVSDFTNDAGYLTADDLPDYLMDSDLDEYALKSDLEDYLKVEELPTNVSDFINDAGYLKAEDLPDYLLDSDLDEYALKSDLDDYLKTEELPVNVSDFINDAGYVKEENLPDYLTDAGYLKAEDLPDYLLDSDLDEYAKTSDLEDYLKSEDLPINVSDFINDAGYLTEHQDLSAYATKAELPTEGFFPDVDGSDDSDAGLDGFATVEGVISYVNALIEKKKDELVKQDYLYTNGYRRGDVAIELTDPLNAYPIVLNENGEFVMELLHKNEKAGYYEPDGDPEDNEYGTYFKVIIPSDYEIKAYLWDEDENDYNTLAAGTPVSGGNIDGGYELVAKDITPDNATYYYMDAVVNFMFMGAKFAIEDTINQTYNGHLLKVVVKKKNN